MTDRTPTKVLGNGAIRYAVYDEQGAFLRYEYMLPADEPKDEGTPLNKANLLTENTAKLHGLTDEATVNDAFAQIAADNGAIGTLRAALAPLDDRWLLCDGSYIKDADYPELAPMLADRLTDLNSYPVKSIAMDGDPASAATEGIEYINGYYIIVRDSAIKYSKSVLGPWNKVDIKLSGSKDIDSTIAFVNGHWLMFGSNGDNSAAYTAPDLAGPWTSKGAYFGNSSSSIDLALERVIYRAPYYIACRPIGNTGGDMLNYAMAPEGPWHNAPDSMSSAYAIRQLFQTKDYVVCNYQSFSGETDDRVKYTNDILGTWTTIMGMQCYGYVKGKYISGEKKSTGQWNIYMGDYPGNKGTFLYTTDKSTAINPKTPNGRMFYSANLNALFLAPNAIIFFGADGAVKKVMKTEEFLAIGTDEGLLLSASFKSIRYLAPVEAQSILPSADIPVGKLYVKALH